MTTPVLQIRDLHLAFKDWRGKAEVLHGISLDVRRGEKVALVGESGSGKSVTARIVTGLLQELPSASVSGAVRFQERELAALPPKEFQRLRGTRISMIFQDPTSSLNPVYTIGDQFHEVLRRGQPGLPRPQSQAQATSHLEAVFIREPQRVLASYPFQLSGGMNQRVMIAMALCNHPDLLIADEPGTALDVTVQAQTLKLMSRLTEEAGTAVLFISHNLGVVREFADRIYVIYRGRMVEQGTVDEVFSDPRHPYTQTLLEAVPKITGGGIPALEENGGKDFGAELVVHSEEARP